MVAVMELLLVVIMISVIIFVLRMLSRGRQQQQVGVVQSNPVSQPSEISGNVIHNVTYNIYDNAIAGDIKTGLNEQDD